MAEEESVVRFVDANIFVRALAWDDPAKARRCAKLFELAERGDARFVTSEAILAEVFYVMKSPRLYAMPRARLATLIRPLVVAPGMVVEHKASILDAIDLYENSNLDFEDCLSVQHVRRQNLDGIYSYDRGFRPALGITRHEP